MIGKDGAETVAQYANSLTINNVDYNEALSAKEYFSHYHDGLHHDNQLNSFNLADDLIEPFRAIVDLTANENIGSNVILSKTERREITGVLHNAFIIDNTKVNVMSAITVMIESLKRIILTETHEKLKLPVILPIENMEGITE